MGSVARIKRILSLLEQLQSGRAIKSEELAQQCGVSRRTVFRDFKLLQQSGVEILYDAKVQGYWVAGQSNLPPINLSLSDVFSLLILTRISAMGEGAIPFQDGAREASLKLQSNLPAHLSSQAAQLLEAFAPRMDPVAHNLEPNREHFDRLVEATSQRLRIRIAYHRPPHGGPQRTLFSPYRLFFRGHAWHVVGRSSLHRSVQTIHVGHVFESDVTEEEFTPPPRFSLKRHFGHAWHLNRERKQRTSAVVRFFPAVAHRVAEVQWHATQKVSWNHDGSIDFEVTVDGLQEISAWILSFGAHARVLSPTPLRRLVASQAKDTARLYSQSGSSAKTSQEPSAK